MTTLAPWIEQWRHFTSDLREQFWSDLTQCTRQSWQDFLGRLSLDARDRYLGVREYERSPARDDARNGFYERDVVTRLGPVRVPVARTRRRALCGWSPGGGGAAVDPKSVLTRAEHACREPRGRAAHGGGGQCTDGLAVDAGLGQAVAQFHQLLLTDDRRGCFSKVSVCGYGDRGATSACSCSPLPEVRGTFTGLTWDGRLRTLRQCTHVA
jgi:hypothetical protein